MTLPLFFQLITLIQTKYQIIDTSLHTDLRIDTSLRTDLRKAFRFLIKKDNQLFNSVEVSFDLFSFKLDYITNYLTKN
jgi:uncharacterized protein YfkK (UPF0435 family)